MMYNFAEMPDIHKNGTKKEYPKVLNAGQYSFDKLVAEVNRASGLQKGAISATVKAVAEEMVKYLVIGHSVKIDGIGTFSPRLEQLKDGESRKAGVRYDSHGVHFDTVNFLPDAGLIDSLRESVHPQFSGYKLALRKQRFTMEERRQRVLDYLNEHHYMKTRDYMRLVGCTHTQACSDLKEMREDPTSGIVAQGSRTSLMYVLAQG